MLRRFPNPQVVDFHRGHQIRAKAHDLATENTCKRFCIPDLDSPDLEWPICVEVGESLYERLRRCPQFCCTKGCHNETFSGMCPSDVGLGVDVGNGCSGLPAFASCRIVVGCIVLQPVLEDRFRMGCHRCFIFRACDPLSYQVGTLLFAWLFDLWPSLVVNWGVVCLPSGALL